MNFKPIDSPYDDLVDVSQLARDVGYSMDVYLTKNAYNSWIKNGFDKIDNLMQVLFLAGQAINRNIGNNFTTFDAEINNCTIEFWVKIAGECEYQKIIIMLPEDYQ